MTAVRAGTFAVRQDGTVRSGTGRVAVAAGILAALRALLLSAPLFGAPLFGALLLTDAPAAAADPVSGLTVSPTHGAATASVNATYRTPGLQGHCPPASFRWDGLPVGTVNGGGVERLCLYALSFPPPGLDRAPGLHTVTAVAGTGVAASTSYRIDLTASPSADRSPSVKPSPTASPKPSRTRAEPTPTESSDDTLAVPPTTDQSAAVAAPPVPDRIPTPASNWTAWAMVGGGALVLGGVLVIGWLFYQGRRAAGVDDGSDAPTVEQPRLPLADT